MTVVIVDDEVYCTDVIQILLTKHCPEVFIEKVFNDAVEALEYLLRHQPDILFLDIEMPRLNGFDLLKKIGNMTSKIIFTTAYDQYAIRAFKFNAIDYLLKPIDKTELIHAVKKSSTLLSLDTIQYVQEVSQSKVPEKILLPIGNELIFVPVKDIICCEADGSYCSVYCRDMEKPYLLAKKLADIEELLNNPKFFRPHTSWLLHETHIQKIVRGDAMEIIMLNQIRIPVARSKRKEILSRLVENL
jgi:two-component system LytT family response regulator